MILLLMSLSTFGQNIKDSFIKNQKIETKITLDENLELLVLNEGYKVFLSTNSLLAIDYYDSMFNDKELKGKIKKIGSYDILYYSTFDQELLKGKVKAIGNYKITYYDAFSAKILQGKVKTIGEIKFEYYDDFSPKDLQGKLKKISGGNDPQINNIFDLNF